MSISLYPHQKKAVEKMKNGCVLVGGVGSGKSLTALTYYYNKVCEGDINNLIDMQKPRDLYIITTARKRDSLEWEKEMLPFLLSTDLNFCPSGVKVVVDSWHNIRNYKNVVGAMFIFDEQKVSGSGQWVKSFLKIAQRNRWILLSATPGDNWMDYIPVFVANGFYKNRTEFIQRHVVYSNFSKYPKIDRYVEVARLIRLRSEILVIMHFIKHTIPHEEVILTDYDKSAFDRIKIDRWNIYENRPIANVSELYYLMRKVVNSDRSRIDAIIDIYKKHKMLIIFYNFDYELELLRGLSHELNTTVAEWNGHKHEDIPKTDEWIYLVQYFSGAEAWNCVQTNVMIFYSQSYSYKTTIQAAGRIDRLNTPYTDLYYYYLRSMSWIDTAIYKDLKNKRNFNESQHVV